MANSNPSMNIVTRKRAATSEVARKTESKFVPILPAPDGSSSSGIVKIYPQCNQGPPAQKRQRPCVPDTIPNNIQVLRAPTTLYQQFDQAKPAAKYRPPDFIPTVIYMRNKLYEVAQVPLSEEPPMERGYLALWRTAIEKQPWYSTENQLKFYTKTARLSSRCFSKVLEISRKIDNGEIASRTQKCTQSTLKDILYNTDEAEQYLRLSALCNGEIDVRGLRKNKTQSVAKKQKQEKEELQRDRDEHYNQYIQLKEQLEEHMKECSAGKTILLSEHESVEKLKSEQEKLTKQVQQLIKEREHWKRLYREAAITAMGLVENWDTEIPSQEINNENDGLQFRSYLII